MNRLYKLLGSGFFSLLSLTACGTNTGLTGEMPFENVQITNFYSVPVNSSTTVRNFIKNVSEYGVNLNSAQLKEISIQRHVKPSGFFDSRPAMNLSADQNLNIHFIKHKHEFKGIFSPDQYLQRAVEFQYRQSASITYYFDVTSFEKGYQSNVVKHDARTRELSALRSNGDITTYYTSDIPSKKRFIIVPEDFSF